MKIRFLVMLLGLILISNANSQNNMERFGWYNPFENGSVDSPFLADLDFSGSIERGFGSERGLLHWGFAVGGMGTFYREGNFALAFGAWVGVYANPYNDISFDPYGANWQESLTGLYKTKYGIFGLGLNHRCRHEIDNYDPGEKDYPLQKRVTLSFGPELTYNTGRINILGFDFMSGLSYQYVPISADYREPDTTRVLDNSNLNGRISFLADVSYPVYDFLKVGIRTYNQISLGLPENNTLLGRAIIYIDLGSGTNRMRIYFGYESIYDDFSQPNPISNQATILGIQLHPQSVY
ncbi:MAG: hypothetical protein Kapaf2KO_05840 [Candidatus Kapaibacteriales bacterium]